MNSPAIKVNIRAAGVQTRVLRAFYILIDVVYTPRGWRAPGHVPAGSGGGSVENGVRGNGRNPGIRSDDFLTVGMDAAPQKQWLPRQINTGSEGCAALAEKLAGLPPLSVLAMKRVLGHTAAGDLMRAMEMETRATVERFTDPENDPAIEELLACRPGLGPAYRHGRLHGFSNSERDATAGQASTGHSTVSA